MSHPLSALFSPKSVAVMGASATPGRSGYEFTKELLEGGFPGRVFPINPKGGEILGRKIYTSLDEVGEQVDLALFLVNKKVAVQSVKDCADHGVKFGVMYSAGFAEQDSEGKRMQDEMVEYAKSKGMRLVGPNCMGIYSAPMSLNLTGQFIPPGDIAMISQSGNLGFQLWHDAANYFQTGFSRFIGIGNQADIKMHEYLDFCREDPHTKVVIMYVEGIGAGTGMDLVRVAAETVKVKPVVILKGGKSVAGRRAASSHTGSMAGATELFDAAFKKAGAIEVKNFDELLPVAHALLVAPPMKGNKIAVGGSGGGQMTISADAAELYGFELPEFSKETNDKLAAMLYDFSPKGNPFDQAGVFAEDIEVYAKTMELVLSEPGIDGAFTFGMFGHFNPDLETNGLNWCDGMQKMVDVSKKLGKPIVGYSVGVYSGYPPVKLMQREGIPLHDSPEIAMRTLKALKEYGDILARDLTIPPPPAPNERTELLKPARMRPNRNLTEPEAYKLLAEYGIPTAKWKLAKSADEAGAAMVEVGAKVVEKIVSPDIVHKSEYGGVKAGISSAGEAVSAFRSIVESCKKKAPDADVHGVLVTEMLKGVEVIAGMVRDEQFGPVLMVGLGGVLVELMKDVAFVLLPATKAEIREKLESLKGYPLLNGYRGSEKCDVDSLIDIVDRLQKLVLENPSIGEIDLNPVFAWPNGSAVADARIIVE